jgi:hypothetical protein
MLYIFFLIYFNEIYRPPPVSPQAAPFASTHMSPTTLMPLPCVRYKADQAYARMELEKQELARRAKAHALKQEQMRAQKEVIRDSERERE